MTDDPFDQVPAFEPSPERSPRGPGDTLRTALLGYVVVNLIFAIPLTLAPSAALSFIGVDDQVASELGGLRLLGAMLAAWAVAGLLVVARPGGRAYFVTAGALQMTAALAALVYSALVGESLGDTWFQIVAIVLVGASALTLWWARVRARAVMY